MRSPVRSSLAFASLALASLALASLAFAAGCDAGARQEAAQVIEAVDRFRKAENPGKPAAVEALRSVKCSAADVCKARDACLATSRPTTKGLLLKHEVESALADLHAGRLSADQAGARALPSKLDEAQRLLDEGHASLSACDAKLTSLRLKYGL